VTSALNSPTVPASPFGYTTETSRGRTETDPGAEANADEQRFANVLAARERMDEAAATGEDAARTDKKAETEDAIVAALTQTVDPATRRLKAPTAFALRAGQPLDADPQLRSRSPWGDAVADSGTPRAKPMKHAGPVVTFERLDAPGRQAVMAQKRVPDAPKQRPEAPQEPVQQRTQSADKTATGPVKDTQPYVEAIQDQARNQAKRRRGNARRPMGRTRPSGRPAPARAGGSPITMSALKAAATRLSKVPYFSAPAVGLAAVKSAPPAKKQVSVNSKDAAKTTSATASKGMSSADAATLMAQATPIAEAASATQTPLVEQVAATRDSSQVVEQVLDRLDTIKLSKSGATQRLTVDMGRQLGRIALSFRLATHSDAAQSKLHVVMETEQTQTKALLQSGLTGLREGLTNRGYVDPVVEVRGGNPSDEGGLSQSDREGSSERNGSEAAANAEANAAAFGRRLRDNQSSGATRLNDVA